MATMSVSRREFVKQAAAVGVALGGGALTVGLGNDLGTDSPNPLRPPGALAEQEFLSTCIRCMRCVDACPNHALVSIPPGASGVRGSTPTMHPRKAACMLCRSETGDYLKCTEVCPSGALRPIRKTREEIKEKVAIGVARIDLDLCYSYNNWSCGACYRACPLAGEAMTIGLWERPTVHPEVCVGCGCCERSCIRYPHAIRIVGAPKPSVVGVTT
ncbi:MAG: 4Fe-4S dicluster domain-containing protein [Planctomycetes bacterium]|nr:4Fe-4S dicluster domain-containing protein [Planctomycetota bacterium]